jgi:hypothetical protein
VAILRNSTEGRAFNGAMSRMAIRAPLAYLLHETSTCEIIQASHSLPRHLNLKLRSGIAPVCDMRDAGVRLGLGCDNCSGTDVRSVFQAMKMFCLLAAVSDPEPGPHRASSLQG